MKKKLGWYKKPENSDKVKQIVKALDKLDNNHKFCFGALDYNGRYFIYYNEPNLSNAVDKYKEWQSDDGYYVEVTTLEGYHDDWKETLIPLTELKEFVATQNCASNKCTEEAASDSPNLSVHLKKKLVLEIKEFADGQCAYRVIESVGVKQHSDAANTFDIHKQSTYPKVAYDTKQALIDAIQEQFTTQGELKVGEICEVKDADAVCWNESRLLAVLPETCKHRYITNCGISAFNWAAWDSARPIIKKIEPKIDDDIYTWEMEVGDE